MNLLKQILLLNLVFITGSLFGQMNSIFLDINDVNARINDRGVLFVDPSTNSAGYETPKGGGNHLIYQGAFWFGGVNQSGNLKLASHLYGIDYDFYAGPYSTSNAYNDPNYQSEYALNIWRVSQVEIDNHINNNGQPGYTMPNGISEWPGNGDPSLGVASQLAPYVDVDSNGVYEPHLGDYPCIKGDMAVYQILHEGLAHNNSGGAHIGAEIHIMTYQYLKSPASDYINATTFVETTVFNRGQNSFDNFKASFFVDTDLGHSEDDYIGSAPSKNMMYSYDATNYDFGAAGAPGYGSNPPAVGVISLNKDIAYSGTFYRPDLGSVYNSDPSTMADYWAYMNGKWKDGSNWTQGGDGYGGTNPTQHLYDGNPNQGTGWTEIDTDGNGTSNTPSDRRLLMTSVEESFAPGDRLTYNYAIIKSRVGDHLENVDGLLAIADSVQSFFDSTNINCFPNGSGNVGLNTEFQNTNIKIYPNPAEDLFNVVWENQEINNIDVISYQGQILQSIAVNGNEGKQVIDVSGLSTGVYFVKIGSWTRKLIIR